jgi:hypothetical protein
MAVINTTPRLASWVTARNGHRHLCLLAGHAWFSLCGGVVLDTEDGPRIPPRCQRCLERSLTEGLVIVQAETTIRI